MIAERDANGLKTLLKIAREHTCALREDLRDIERARAAAGGALSEIDNEGTPADERNRRRTRLATTFMTLERAEADAYARLAFACGEFDKLERLMRSGARPEIGHPLGAGDIFQAAEG